MQPAPAMQPESAVWLTNPVRTACCLCSCPLNRRFSLHSRYLPGWQGKAASALLDSSYKIFSKNEKKACIPEKAVI